MKNLSRKIERQLNRILGVFEEGSCIHLQKMTLVDGNAFLDIQVFNNSEKIAEYKDVYFPNNVIGNYFKMKYAFIGYLCNREKLG